MLYAILMSGQSFSWGLVCLSSGPYMYTAKAPLQTKLHYCNTACTQAITTYFCSHFPNWNLPANPRVRQGLTPPVTEQWMWNSGPQGFQHADSTMQNGIYENNIYCCASLVHELHSLSRGERHRVSVSCFTVMPIHHYSIQQDSTFSQRKALRPQSSGMRHTAIWLVQILMFKRKILSSSSGYNCENISAFLNFTFLLLPLLTERCLWADGSHLFTSSPFLSYVTYCSHLLSELFCPVDGNCTVPKQFTYLPIYMVSHTWRLWPWDTWQHSHLRQLPFFNHKSV
jgi:hypothetical protein